MGQTKEYSLARAGLTVGSVESLIRRSERASEETEERQEEGIKARVRSREQMRREGTTEAQTTTTQERERASD